MASMANGAQLSELERQALLSEWAYIKARARFLAERLGFENPFPTKQERQEQYRLKEIDIVNP